MQNHKNEALGASGGLWGAGQIQNCKRLSARRSFRFFFVKVIFWAPFRAPVDFEGGRKIAVLGIMLQKNKEKEVQERLQKKHDF